MTAYDPADFGALLGEVVDASGGDVERLVHLLPPPVARRIKEEFFCWQAHGGQREPDWPEPRWRVWLLMAGRGFGKTRAGAEWVSERARAHPGARIALIGATRDDVVKVMVEGPSGLLSVARSDEAPCWVPTRGTLRFSSGAEAYVYSAQAHAKLRGPQHHYAWADELAKWPHGREAWDNLQMGLRLGDAPAGTAPRMIVTTTPKPAELVRAVRRARSTSETGGRTADNAHLSADFLDWAGETYGGTRIGRQELDGVLFEEVEGALWTRTIIERARRAEALPQEALERVVIGVDPPASADGDACGIVVCAMGRDGIAYVLADCSVKGMRPEGWARAAAEAAAAWEANLVIAEKNQGGDMVGSVLTAVDAGLPVRLVSATSGKAARAEPVALAFETGKARLAGRFPELEDELAGLTAGRGYQGPGRSPDRADAMVWAMSALLRPRPEPRLQRV